MHKSVSGMLRIVPLCLAALGAQSCTYEPAHDYSMVVNWLLNGATPDSSRCKELGIKTVRLTIERPNETTEVEGPCDETMILSDGIEYGAFETTRSFDFGVGYSYAVEHLDAKGNVLFSSPNTKTAYYGDYTPVELDIVDVFEPVGDKAELTAAWVFEGGTPDSVAQDCARLGIERVALWIASATDPQLSNNAVVLAEAECSLGQYASTGAVLARGNYVMQYVALDSRTAVAELGAPIPFSVDKAGIVIDLPRQVFKGL